MWQSQLNTLGVRRHQVVPKVSNYSPPRQKIEVAIHFRTRNQRARTTLLSCVVYTDLGYHWKLLWTFASYY